MLLLPRNCESMCHCYQLPFITKITTEVLQSLQWDSFWNL